MATVSVRYIVDDVDAAIEFYCGRLGFHEDMQPAPGGGPGGGGQPMPDGTVPEPGGWNRFKLKVRDLQALVERLRESGATFRNDIVTGVGGSQILVDDPSGNPIELFEPTRQEAFLADG